MPTKYIGSGSGAASRKKASSCRRTPRRPWGRPGAPPPRPALCPACSDLRRRSRYAPPLAWVTQSQRYNQCSGPVWFRIRILLLSTSKTWFLLFYDFSITCNLWRLMLMYCICSTVRKKQKNLHFVGILKFTAKERRTLIRICYLEYGSKEPDQYVTDPEHWL